MALDAILGKQTGKPTGPGTLPNLKRTSPRALSLGCLGGRLLGTAQSTDSTLGTHLPTTTMFGACHVLHEKVICYKKTNEQRRPYSIICTASEEHSDNSYSKAAVSYGPRCLLLPPKLHTHFECATCARQASSIRRRGITDSSWGFSRSWFGE